MSFDPVSQKDALLRFAEAVERFQFTETPEEIRSLLPAGIRELADRASDYKSSATLNLDWWDDTLTSVVRLQEPLEENRLITAFGVLGRIFRESDMTRGVSPAGVRQQYFDFFSRNDLSGELAAHSDFIRNAMSVYIAREVLRRTALLNQSIEQATQGWDASFKEYSGKVELYKKNLDGQAQKYNFMGLSQAFMTVVDSKVVESRVQLALLVITAVALIGVPGYNYVFPQAWATTAKGIVNFEQGALAHVIVAVALEIVLVYLFRVVLKSYIATQNQVVNLRLRSSLCAFVEQYASFAQTIKSKSTGDPLARFEQVIFSHAPTYDGKIPEVTDGAEQVIEIARNLRK